LYFLEKEFDFKKRMKNYQPFGKYLEKKIIKVFLVRATAREGPNVNVARVGPT
jgi:hypothetical protein